LFFFSSKKDEIKTMAEVKNELHQKSSSNRQKRKVLDELYLQDPDSHHGLTGDMDQSASQL